MVETDWTFGAGGVSLTLTGPTACVEPFKQAWSSWAGGSPGWRVRLVQDATLPVPDGPFFAARPHFEGGRCLLEAQGLVGEVLPDEKQALLRAHPTAETADLAYFVRTVFALRAFDCGALLFHAAGIVHRGSAYAFFGHSGSGKTTAASLSKGKPILNDDLLLLCRAGPGWDAWATPLGKHRDLDARSAPLRALLRLAQASEERLESMPPGVALGELVANSPVVNADPARSMALLTRWEEIVRRTSVFRLYFRKSDTFWEVIDARLG